MVPVRISDFLSSFLLTGLCFPSLQAGLLSGGMVLGAESFTAGPGGL